MYGYYGLSACGRQIQKYLWWKRYLTQAQMVSRPHDGRSIVEIRLFVQLQFIAVIIHSTINLQIQCNFPKVFDLAFLAYGVTILMLFANFYLQSYIVKKDRRRKD